jgi:cellulose synthase/poly-beta-1,6-N-acetylglucosamine synthase-like glycosyltransferase
VILESWSQAALLIVAGVFILCQALLAVYGLHRYLMVGLYYRHRRDPQSNSAPPQVWPVVTVQLPVHNEIHVIERLIDSVCALDYPAGRLEIQVLDDSSDETTVLAETRASLHRGRGIDIKVLHRENRNGFKAGALANGVARARGELLAVFDADFLPPPDFLRRAVPHFQVREIGMVQTRWGHINRGYSSFTGIQAVFLDSHFLIEHQARHGSQRFFNFNGTAGVWRRECIEAAGGWQADTLTEDLDLSYRAQLCGWQFRFLPDVVAPAELPVDIGAFKTQQRRWAKGSIQTAIKMLPAVWKSHQPLKVKIESFFHLTSNFSYLLFLVSAFLLPPLLLMDTPMEPHTVLFWTTLFLAGTVGVCVFFAVSQRAQGLSWTRALLRVPSALALGMGMSLTQARAVIEALGGVMGDWERTPKYAITRRQQNWRHKRYADGTGWAGVGEMASAVYFAGVIALAAGRGQLAPIPFLILLVSGLAYVGGLSWRVRPARSVEPNGETLELVSSERPQTAR